MARIDASRLSEGGGATTAKTPAEKAAIQSQVDAVVAQTKFNQAVASNPLTKVTPASPSKQVGPMIGANLGKDAAAVITSDPTVKLPAETKTAAEEYNVSQGLNPDGSKKPAEISKETKDAFAEMTDILKQWGLESLADTYGRLMVQGFSAAEALNKLKYDKTVDPITGKPWNAAYTVRFAGNAARVAKGMNAYDEGTYLEVENTYDETLRKYGLSNLISPDKAVAQAKYAEYMGNGIAPTEFAERIQTVADRVINMDPAIKAQFQAYYPSLTNTDLVSYFLDPKETLPVLKNKVTAAEIGAVAGAAKYGIDETRAMDLAKFGVTREQALTGYQDVAEAVPTGTKLSGIYNEEGIKYGQSVAEDEYLKQDAQAKLKRNRLASKERAMFSGQSGVDQNSLQRGKSSAY
jgi:hypothetical protein